MNFLIMCPRSRFEVKCNEKISKGDKFTCFSTCPKKATCPNASKNEFSVLSVMTMNSLKNPIDVKKVGNCFCKIGDENLIKTENSIQNSQNTVPFGGNAAPQNQNLNNQTQNQGGQNGFVAFNNPSQNNNNQTGFVGFGFNTANNASQNNQTQTFNQPTGGASSYRDRFGFNRPQNVEVKKKISDSVRITDFNSVMLGGRIYSNDFTLQRTKGAFPLGRLLEELKTHWQVNFVFKDPHNLTREFIWVLLKLGIIPNAKKEELIQELLDNTIYENPVADQNSKFFYLLMNVIPQSKNNGFYFSEGYSFARLVPLFMNVEDYVSNFFLDNVVGENFRSFCQKNIAEVMYYLGYSDKWPTKETRAKFLSDMIEKQNSLFNDFIIRNYERSGHFVYLDKVGDKFFVEDLGNADSFVQGMLFTQPIEVQRKKVAFLKKFRITKEGMLLPRAVETPLFESSKVEYETSNVYSALNLTSPSYYLEEFNLYTTLIREYLSIFEPADISLNGVIYITRGNFIGEVHKILLDACEAALCNDLPYRENLINKAMLLYVLLKRGILDYFVTHNQSEQQYSNLLKIYEKLIKNQLTVEEYSKTFKNEALFYLDGESLSARDYLLKSINLWQLNEVSSRLANNQILSFYFKHDVEKEKAIEARVKKFDTMFKNFMK